MGILTVRIAQMKSPVSLLSVSRLSTLVQTTLLSASHLIRSAMEKWTALTVPTKDSSAVMFVLSVHVISFCVFCHPTRCKVILEHTSWPNVCAQDIAHVWVRKFSFHHCEHQYAAAILLGRFLTRLWRLSTDLAHSWCSTSFQTCLMGLRSALCAGQSTSFPLS